MLVDSEKKTVHLNLRAPQLLDELAKLAKEYQSVLKHLST